MIDLLELRQFSLAQEKFMMSLRSKVDSGFEALAQQVRGNAEAETLVARLREIIPA